MLNRFNQTFGQNTYPSMSMYNNPYMQNTSLPQPMAGDMTEDNLYPMESQSTTPFNTSPPVSFAKGGQVKKKKSYNPYPSLAEMIRQQGQGEDSILAHINPLEARMLKQMGGSGTINKKTGLPQFGFFNKPGKALKSIMGGAGGAIIGNMILPGIGGVIGGALGQGLQHKSRGKSFGAGALKGGMMGAGLPSAAGLLGSGASALGMNTAGNYLTNYGAANAILPSIGMGGSDVSSPLSNMISPTKSLGGSGSIASNPITQQIASAKEEAPLSFIDSLKNNSSKFLSKPKNLLTLGSVAGSMLNKPKEKSPEKLAQEQKRYMQAMMLTPAERAALEADKLSERQMERRIARNQYLPEELFEPNPVYRKTSTPAEYKKSGRWLNYYNKPDYSGRPLHMKHGGRVPNRSLEKEELVTTPHMNPFLYGHTKGQDDKIDAQVSAGEVIIPSDVVAHVGDGNSNAGGDKFDKFVKNVRKSKGMPNKLPPKAKSILNYMR
jgi:hypothetical protein